MGGRIWQIISDLTGRSSACFATRQTMRRAEGFMCSLLNQKFQINRFLDSESNQQTENDKFNRVDILTKLEGRIHHLRRYNTG